MSAREFPIYSCSECRWEGRRPISAEVPTCPDCGAAVAPIVPKSGGRASAIAAVLVGSLPLWGCAVAPDTLFVEGEHVSHPFAGPPFGPREEEDSVNLVNVGAEWAHGGAYLQAALGYKVADRGFYGPPITGSVRAGWRFPLRQVRP